MAQDTMATRIRRRRKALGWNLNDLAERSGIAYQSVQQYEGGTQPTASKLVPLARALGVSAEWLWDGRDDQALSPEEWLLVSYYRDLSQGRQHAFLLSLGLIDEQAGTPTAQTQTKQAI